MFLIAAIALLEGLYYNRLMLIDGLGAPFFSLVMFMSVMLAGVAAYGSLLAPRFHNKVGFMVGIGMYVAHVTGKARFYMSLTDDGLLALAFLLVAYVGMPVALCAMALFVNYDGPENILDDMYGTPDDEDY